MTRPAPPLTMREAAAALNVSRRLWRGVYRDLREKPRPSGRGWIADAVRRFFLEII